MKSSISKEELLPIKSLEIIITEDCDDKEYSKNDDEKEVYKNHIYYDKCIRNGFYAVFVMICFIISILIQIHTSRINHFNRYFYDSCNVSGIISVNDLFSVNSAIHETQEKLEIATQNLSSHEINATEFSFLEKSLNESLELCAAQHTLRESCFIRELKFFAKTQNQIFKFIVLPYFALLLFIMPTYFAFCCKKLLKFSVDDDDIDDTQHAKKVIKVFLFIMTIFGVLLYIQFAPKNISTKDVPLICGSMTSKFLTKECYDESEGCYAFPKMSEYIPELYYMFWLYFFIAFSCFTFFAFYHGSKFQDYYSSS